MKEKGQGRPDQKPTSESGKPQQGQAPEAGPKDKSPVKDSPKRRWRSSSVGGGSLHGYCEDECQKPSENKSPVKHPWRRRGGGAL